MTVQQTPLDVTYKGCENVLAEAVSNNQVFHLVVHLGDAEEGIAGYRLEKTARAGGYVLPDGHGKLPDASTQPTYWNDNNSLESSVRMADVHVRWQSERPVSRNPHAPDIAGGPREMLTSVQDSLLIASTDAGHSLCEYLFYSSLAYLRHTGNEGVPWHDRTTVEFLHIPDNNDEARIIEGRDVVMSLVYSIIDSRRQRDGDYNEEGIALA